jgi:hypothetical protein
MKRFFVVLSLVIVALGILATRYRGVARTTMSVPAEPQSTATPTPQTNRYQEANDRLMKQVLEKIAGHENEPAEKVFKNIQIPWLKSTPAGRFLRIMNGGYSRALGVECEHCHVQQDFSSDDKRPKRAARDMAYMHKAINDQIQKMQNLDLKPEHRFINCSTCHRGAINPNG